MSTETSLFEHNSLRIEYLSDGNGPEIILAFHGFGQDESGFDDLLPLIKPYQRLIRIRLFQHGKSLFPEDRIPQAPLKKKEWSEFIHAFLNHLNTEKCSLLGYSMGARVCLNLLETDQSRIKEVLLLAPDGFKINALYQFSSNTALGRSIYRFVMNNPTVLFKFADLLNGIGLLSAKLHRFVHFHMRNHEQRKLVYDTWVIYRKMHPDLKKLRQLLLHDPLKFSAVFGRYDAIIKPSIGKAFFKPQLSEHMYIVDSGHLLINPQTTDFIEKNGLWFGN